MQLALISDIHGNLPALEAVLNDINDEEGIDTVVCAGDVVGYGPWPGECVERVRERCSVVVQGNHDRSVETPDEYSHNEMAMGGLDYAKRELDEEQREWLAELTPRTTIARGRIQLVHSHPDPDHRGRYVRPRAFPEMRPYLDECDSLVLGHTHVQHRAHVDGKLIVNPGSVGQPRDGDARAAYAVLDSEDTSVDLRRVEYDIDRVIQRVEEVGLPRRIGTRLLDGR
ncbi:metallophosphoesterase family protein [Natronorubrum tibetense]|uniref:Phosphoesterase n=1 Tax=Natronorubrum tibetense GA33 TaxID=1114856 RepID=L9VF46_9EURY|nr:metallophosphoesterase family protein [Natronorubrum tibetense]ELY35572.1 phosphodiesterase, MJ0936 family protein [Natronorubrum tibetense GA33]